MRARMTAMVSGPGGGLDFEACTAIGELLHGAEDLASKTTDGRGRLRRLSHRILAFIGWESAPELASLQKLNAAELLLWRHEPDQQEVGARIVQAESQLEELSPDQQRVWRAAFAEFWRGDASRPLYGGPCPDCPSPDGALPFWRAQLCAFLRDLYESRQVRGARMSSLQQKAMWGVVIALWTLVALVVAGDGHILLAGAIGGLLSRLTRFTGIRWLTTDFGLGWAQLYLAPPVGALAAWAGLHVWLVLQEVDAVGLQTIINPTSLAGEGPEASAVFGVALALGFSERLFDRLLRQAADTIAPPATAAAPASSAPSPARSAAY